MANEFRTGVSATPIDITSGARAFSRAALESRLQEIASSREEISENEKKILKAMSVNAPAELFQRQRERFMEDESKLRQKTIDTFKQTGGKLSTQQMAEIEDDFRALETKYKGEALSVAAYDEFKETLNDPRTKDLFDHPKAIQALTDAYTSIEETGKMPSDFSAKWAMTFREDSPATYLDKFYESDLKTLPIFESADYDGNMFKTIEQRGIGVGDAEAEEKAIRTRDRILQTDPKYVRQYTMPDGSINEEAYSRAKTEVEDWMNAYNERAQKGRTSTGDDSDYDAYVSTTPAIEQIDGSDVEYAASIGTTEIPSFAFGDKKVIAEGIFWLPNVKNDKEYKKAIDAIETSRFRTTGDVSRVSPIGKNVLSTTMAKHVNKGSVGYEPYVKLIVPREKGTTIPLSSKEYLQMKADEQKKYKVVFEPLSNQSLKSALFSRMQKKRGGFEQAIDRLNAQFGGGQRETKFTGVPEGGF